MSALRELITLVRDECGADRAESVQVLVDLGMIEAVVDREDEPVLWKVTAKGRRALEAACDRERAL